MYSVDLGFFEKKKKEVLKIQTVVVRIIESSFFY